MQIKGVGLYLVPVERPDARVKITRIADNTPTKITGVLPLSTGYQYNRLEIVTQFAGSGSIQLKTPRTIVSSFTLEEI